MTDKEWRGKGEMVVRRSPRKKGQKCGRPFIAPRKVTSTTTNQKDIDPKQSKTKETDDSDVQVMPDSEVQNDSEVQFITETQNAREITAIQDILPQTKEVTIESDSTGSTPDIFRSPLRGKSEYGIPVATVLRPEKGINLTQQQIQDCKEGSMGQRAVGVTVAKTFDGVEFRGTIDRFRQARKRMYYHVTYTDGDEEELSQTELRDCYLLGLKDDIERQWRQYKETTEGNTIDQDNDNCEDDGSDEDGSQYDNSDYNEEVRHKRKERKEQNSRKSKKKKAELYGIVLPRIKLLLQRLTANWTINKRNSSRKK
jgi:hypothetical protein